MKIISKYKDYYDYVAYQYGEDPLIVYNRQPFKHNDELFKYVVDQMRYKSCYFPTRHVAPKPNERHYKWLVINAKLYLLTADDNQSPYKVITPELYQQIIADGNTFELSSSWSRRIYPYLSGYEYYIANNILYDTLVAASRVLNTPVFEISDLQFGCGIIETGKCKIPVLSELGIASIIPAEKIFQELSYFIGNVMKDTPDVKPPVTIDNDLRIEGHGFDLKQSFRHRK